MTQEEKDLVIRDLCGRSSYGVMCKRGPRARKVVYVKPYQLYAIGLDNGEYISQEYTVEDVKPFLRPMSSMTKEERKEYHNLCYEEEREQIEYGEWVTRVYYHDTIESIDWLNKHHFDYRGLIPKGLALEAPDGMYDNEPATQITVGCKIRSKTNPDVILRIVSDDCHGDKFECSNGSVLSLEQIKKHYDLYVEENKGTIVIN